MSPIFRTQRQPSRGNDREVEKRFNQGRKEKILYYDCLTPPFFTFFKANVMPHDIFYEHLFFSPISDAARTIDQDIGGPLIQGSD